MTQVFGGIDLGTSSMKAVLVEVEGDDCRLVWSSTQAYNDEGAPERSPAQWWRVANILLDEMVNVALPEAIGFSGQMHTLLAVDDKKQLIAPVKLWLDMDGDAALARFPLTQSDWVAKTANIPLPDFTLAKWLWAKEQNPALPRQTSRLYCAKDYLRQLIDPSARFVTDRNEAAGMQCYDAITDDWESGILEMADIPPSALPQLDDATAISGVYAPKDHRGEPILLVTGAGDQATAARAVGGYRSGIVSVSLGTSGVLSFPLRKENLSSDWTGDFHLFPFGFGEHLQVIGTIPALGPTLLWLQRTLNLSREAFIALSGKALGHETEVLFLPFLSGSGAPEPNHKITASWGNLTVHSSSLDLVRAAFNGIALDFAHIAAQAKTCGVEVSALHFSGGGTHIQPLLHIIAQVTAVPCFVSDSADASAVGAALLAADALIPDNRAVLSMSEVPSTAVSEVSDAYRGQWHQHRAMAMRSPTR